MSAMFRPWHVQCNTRHTQSRIMLFWMSNNISLPSLVAEAQYPILSRRTPMSKVNRLQHVQRVALGHRITKGSRFDTFSNHTAKFAPLGPPI